MLDSTPVPRNQPRSPRFHEHISELADTSSPPPISTHYGATPQWSTSTYPQNNPPTSEIPRTEAILPNHDNSRMEDARRRQHELHLMSWNVYNDNNRGVELQDRGIEATIGRGEVRQGGNGNGNGNGVEKKEGKVSPDESDSPLDRKFIVSPMGTLERERR